MFVLPKTYDPEEIAKNNMHTHTHFSLCAKPEMELAAMVKAAEEAGLSTLAITDHCDPGSKIDVLSNTKTLKKLLKGIDTPVRVLIGSELSSYGVGKWADNDELNSALDYRGYSSVHYHLESWEHPADRSPRGYAEHMLAVLEALLKADRADCIVHPFSPGKFKFFSVEEKTEMLGSITDNELGDILSLGEEHGCAWELHLSSIAGFPDFYRRLFFIGKEAGVHFNAGTDAHNLSGISTANLKEQLINLIK